MEVRCGEDSVVFEALGPFQWSVKHSRVEQNFTQGEAVLESMTLEGPQLSARSSPPGCMACGCPGGRGWRGLRVSKGKVILEHPSLCCPHTLGSFSLAGQGTAGPGG